MGHFIQEGLDGKSSVRVPHRAPPLHRDADLRRVQVHLHVGNAVKYVRGAFDRRGVYAVLDSERLEERALHDRLADNRVRPSDRIAVCIQTCHEAVMPHRPVPTSLQIVFASPDDFYRGFGGFGHVNCFHHKVRSGIRAPAKSSAQQCGMNLHLFRSKTRHLCRVCAVYCFKLGSRPDFATVRPQIDNTVQRFHHRVCQVRHVVLGCNGLRRRFQSCCRVACLFGDRSRLFRHLCEIAQHLVRREPRVRSQIPIDDEFVPPDLRRPETRSNDGYAGRHLFHCLYTRDL